MISGGKIEISGQNNKISVFFDFGSPEGSYQYRFYQMAADGLPMIPINFQPPVDGTLSPAGGRR